MSIYLPENSYYQMNKQTFEQAEANLARQEAFKHLIMEVNNFRGFSAIDFRGVSSQIGRITKDKAAELASFKFRDFDIIKEEANSLSAELFAQIQSVLDNQQKVLEAKLEKLQREFETL